MAYSESATKLEVKVHLGMYLHYLLCYFAQTVPIVNIEVMFTKKIYA